MGFDHAARAPVQMARFARGDAMAAALRLAHHGKGGVLVGLEVFERIGDVEEIHGVATLGACGRTRSAVLLHKERRAARDHAPKCRPHPGDHHAAERHEEGDERSLAVAFLAQ